MCLSISTILFNMIMWCSLLNNWPHRNVAMSVIFGGVTNIKEVLNQTPHNIEIAKWDTPWDAAGAGFETTGNIPPRGTFSGNMWVPWVNSASEFSVQKIAIKVDRRIMGYIWQTGDYIRYISVNEIFSVNAPRAPGLAQSGGERKLIFFMTGNRISFRIERL